jgi:hypothetical protein
MSWGDESWRQAARFRQSRASFWLLDTTPIANSSSAAATALPGFCCVMPREMGPRMINPPPRRFRHGSRRASGAAPVPLSQDRRRTLFQRENA